MRDSGTELIVALDAPSWARAEETVDRLEGAVDFYKVGLELFVAEGPSVVRALRDRGYRVFLDLKLLDIPNTVAGAVRAAKALEVDLLTLHAAGSRPMLTAAVEAAEGQVRLLGVTVLTSTDDDALSDDWGRSGVRVADEVVRLAARAQGLGVPGVVASVAETAEIRRQCGRELVVVTPGIRLPGQSGDDQARVAAPSDAVDAGSDFVVVGRAITAAPDPMSAAREVRSRLGGVRGVAT